MRIVCDSVGGAGIWNGSGSTAAVETNLARELGMELTITSDYYSSFRGRTLPVRKVSAEEYLHGPADQWPDRSVLCPEMPLGQKFTPLVQFCVEPGAAWTKNAVVVVHAGRTDCVAPIHFDWDHSWVAHACLTGRKRFFLFPPEAGWLLCPIVNTSALFIPRFPECDRRELLSQLGGTEIVLEAGQGILFPSMSWHGVLYEEASLSISVRFEQHPGGRPFAVLPRSWWLQRLVWRFFQQGYGTAANEFLSDYLESFFKRRSWHERYRRTIALCRKALHQCGERYGVDEWVAENFSPEMALAAQELRFYYGSMSDPGDAPNDDILMETTNYIFAEISRLPRASKRLAAYALKVRQGLPPRRGLVQIAHH